MHHPVVASLAGLKAAVPPRYKRAARRAFLRAAAFTSTGSAVCCPCCGREASHFVRFHGEHDQCPGCGSLMRQRVLLLLLRERYGLPRPGARILHVGPSQAVANWFQRQRGIDYVSADLDSPVAMMQADATDLPFEDESFDFAISVHVLEHIPEDRKALSEFFRVLRPGGEAVFQVPPSDLEVTREDYDVVTDPGERERLFGQYDHVRLCGADYPERIAETGFDVSREDFVAQLDEARRRRFGLRLGEPFDLCVKPEAA
jgi:SAM-dependent methyltransferase